ncbi:MAG TPA: hypothetical protein VKA55_02715 [Gammaproteobacteria bacterium]|nr:hypothetical protein [Gammaproteobacteria bacterium]
MYSDSARASIHGLLSEAARRYHQAAEEASDTGEAGSYRERASLLEALADQVQAGDRAPAGSPAA